MLPFFYLYHKVTDLNITQVLRVFVNVCEVTNRNNLFNLRFELRQPLLLGYVSILGRP